MLWIAIAVSLGVASAAGVLLWQAARAASHGRALRWGAWVALGLGALLGAGGVLLGHLIEVLPLARQCVGWGFAGWTEGAAGLAVLAHITLILAGIGALGGAGLTASASWRGAFRDARDEWSRAWLPLGILVGLGGLWLGLRALGLLHAPALWLGVPGLVLGGLPVVLVSLRSARLHGEKRDSQASLDAAEELALHRVRTTIAASLGVTLLVAGIAGLSLVGSRDFPGQALMAAFLGPGLVVGLAGLGAVLGGPSAAARPGRLALILVGIGLASVVGPSAAVGAVYRWSAAAEVDCASVEAHGLIRVPFERLDR